MKKQFLFIALISLSFSVLSQSAVDYMKEIGGEFKLIQSATWDYTKSVAKNKSARKVNKNRLELVQTVQKSLAKVKKIGAFGGETYFRDSVVSFLEVNLAVVAEDYEKIMNLEDIAESSYDLMDAYIKAKEVAGDKLSAAGDMVDEIERKFAKDNDITLIESTDKIGLKLKKASEVYTYYNPVYLIFFKSYKQEAYLMDALAKGDVSGMEQAKGSLSKFSNEGLAKMKEITHYNNDATLKKACEDMLKFYVEESEQHFQKLIDYHAKKETFDEAKKNIEAKKSKGLSQEDVDAFNKLVKEFNEATNEFNNTNTNLNNRRNKLINNWNDSAANFTNKHIM